MEMETTYQERNLKRQAKLNFATMSQIDWFIDNQEITLLESQTQMQLLSTEVAQWLYAYIMGNTIPLIQAVQNTELPFMTEEAKLHLISNLE